MSFRYVIIRASFITLVDFVRLMKSLDALVSGLTYELPETDGRSE